MQAPSSETLLTVWERGRRLHPLDRAALLRALAAPDTEPDTLVDEPLGRRNAALLRLRIAAFGDRIRAYVDCPSCGSRLEAELEASTLLQLPLGTDTPVEVEGTLYRQPTTRDLAALAAEAPGADVAPAGATDAEASLRLLGLCRVGGREIGDDKATEPLLDRVSAALECADPWVELVLDLRCDKCDHAWEVPFDIGAFLWEEWSACAEQLLDEIHLLARSYGWSEATILSLSNCRRTAYLERAMA